MTTYIPHLTLPAALFHNAAASILLPVVAGSAVGYATSPKKTQKTYMELRQPPLRPPPWLFGPVWTALYGTMGWAAYRAWTTGINSLNPETVALTKQGATLYTIQLALNLIWMPIFFHFKRPVEASLDIVALTGTVGYLAHVWSKVDETAAYALVPYLAWLSFANYLCIGTGYLNNWNFQDKEVPKADKPAGTKYVDEKP